MEHPPGSKFVDMRPYYAPLSVRAINGEEVAKRDGERCWDHHPTIQDAIEKFDGE